MKSVTWQTLKWDCWKYVMSAFMVTAGYKTNPTRAILQLTRDFKGQQGCHFKENSAISGLLKEVVKWLYPAIAEISMFRLLLIWKRCMKWPQVRGMIIVCSNGNQILSSISIHFLIEITQICSNNKSETQCLRECSKEELKLYHCCSHLQKCRIREWIKWNYF